MKSMLWKSLVGMSAALLISASANAQSIIYDNTAAAANQGEFYTAGNSGNNPIEYGDQIHFAGTDRLVTSFSFELYATNTTAAVLSGDESGTLFIRAQDGAQLGAGVFAPGSVLYQHSFAVNSGLGYQTVDLSGLSVALPEAVTWSVLIGGVAGDERVGLVVRDPVSVGASLTGGAVGSFADFWQMSETGWELRVLDSGNPANFAAQVSAVPEPSTLVLGILGGLALLGLKRRSS